jgi:hypothetical protein
MTHVADSWIMSMGLRRQTVTMYGSSVGNRPLIVLSKHSSVLSVTRGMNLRLHGV